MTELSLADLEALQSALRETLGAEARVERPDGTPVHDTRADPIAVATLILAVPPALLAAHDLAQRIQLGTALQRLRERLEGRAAKVRVGERELDLATSEPYAILEAAGKAEAAGQPVWDVFISYARPDRAIADRIYERLTQERRAFLDHRSVGAGEVWPTAIWNAQRTARATLLVLSPRWSGAWFQQDELLRAIQLKRAHGHAVLPLYLDGLPSTPDAIPPGLMRLQSIGVPEAGGLEAALEEVAKSLPPPGAT